MTTPAIIALDLGKFNPVACLYPRGGKATPTFLTLSFSREDLPGLLARTRCGSGLRSWATRW
jgi:hypothetical protein